MFVYGFRIQMLIKKSTTTTYSV